MGNTLCKPITAVPRELWAASHCFSRLRSTVSQSSTWVKGRNSSRKFCVKDVYNHQIEANLDLYTSTLNKI